MPLIDGLGFEEVNQSGLSTELVQTTSGVHTRLVATNVIGTTNVSGLDIFAAGSLLASRLTEPNGAVFSSVHGGVTPGSPGTFGAIVQAGRVGPLIAATGSIVFPIAFTNRNYVVTLSPESPIGDGVGSTVPYTLSGVSHATSGCTITAVSGTAYLWVAVGR